MANMSLPSAPLSRSETSRVKSHPDPEPSLNLNDILSSSKTIASEAAAAPPSRSESRLHTAEELKEIEDGSRVRDFGERCCAEARARIDQDTVRSIQALEEIERQILGGMPPEILGIKLGDLL